MSHLHAGDTTPITPGEEVNTIHENLEHLQQLREREIQLWEDQGLTHPSKMSPEQFEQFFSTIQRGGQPIPEELRLVDYDGLLSAGDQPPGTAVVLFEPSIDTNGQS